MNGDEPNVRALADPEAESGVASGRVLLEFAAATVGDDDTELARSREALRRELGDAGVADAAAVTSNFERMVRIADSIGIELGDRLESASEEVRSELSLERLRSRPDAPGELERQATG